MRIALIGYGKMGKSLEPILLQRGHSITARINNFESLRSITSANTDLAIEFSLPDVALANLSYCFEQGISVVCGTTGWLDKFPEASQRCIDAGVALFTASNFSLGVNLFFHFNKIIASVMNKHSEYNVSVDEIHHIYKKDAPSGTAISLANILVNQLDQKKEWILGPGKSEEQLTIESIRKGEVPGTHIVKYESSIDSISLQHEALGREGFALGAVLAAEFLEGKKGIFSMSDLLGDLS